MSEILSGPLAAAAGSPASVSSIPHFSFLNVADSAQVPRLPFLSEPSFEAFMDFKLAMLRLDAQKALRILPPLNALIDPSVGVLFTAEKDAELPTDSIANLLDALQGLLRPENPHDKLKAIAGASFAPRTGRPLRVEVPLHVSMFEELLKALDIPKSKQPGFLIDSFRSHPRLHELIVEQLVLLDAPDPAAIVKAALSVAKTLDGFDSEYAARFRTAPPPVAPARSAVPLSAAPRPAVSQPSAPARPPSPTPADSRPPSPRFERHPLPDIAFTLSPADRAFCLHRDLCFNCRKPGHSARDCPHPPSRSSSRLSRPPDRFDPCPPRAAPASALPATASSRPTASPRPIAGAVVADNVDDDRPAFWAWDSDDQDREVRVIPDSGANVSLAAHSYLTDIGHGELDTKDNPLIAVASGQEVRALGSVLVHLDFAADDIRVPVKVYAVPVLADEGILLGHDVLARYYLDVTANPPLIKKSDASMFVQRGAVRKPAAPGPPT